MKIRTKDRIVAMIPAKLGSTRLAMKNLALVGGKPLIYYPIKAARDAGVFSQVIINSEDSIFSAIARRYGVDFYKRPDSLVSPTTKTDTVVYDFLKKHPCDIVAWVSPIAPFQTGGEVADIVRFFVRERLDSLMTVKEEMVHCVHGGRPVNFSLGEIFAQTQDLVPAQLFVYTVMMWRARPFMKAFEKRGHAVLCGKVGYYPVSKFSSIIVKKPEDLMLAESVMRALSRATEYTPRYDRLVDKVRVKGAA